MPVHDVSAKIGLALLAYVLVTLTSRINALDCSFCGEGVTMGSPERNYSWSTEPVSCAEFENDFNETFINDEGQEVCDLDGFWIDMAAYCNCEGHTMDTVCDFCASGTIINPDLLVDAPEGSDLSVSMTCEQAGLATQYISDEKTCLSLKLLFAPSCCLMPNSTTESSNQTQCSICPTGSTMQNPDKSLFFIGDGLTCETGQSILTGLASETECAAAKDRFDRLPFDIGAWCECSGVSPPNACALCSQSPTGSLLDEDAEVDLGNNITVTCQEAEMLASFINDASVCDQQYQTAIRTCCSGVPTAPIAPSPTSAKETEAPTFATSTASALIGEPSRYHWASLLVMLLSLVS